MVDAARLTDVLKLFARALVTDYTLVDLLDRFCHDTVAVLGVAGAGIMLEDEVGDLRFLAASDETVRSIESLQIDIGEGPCLHAYKTGELCLVPDLNHDGQFPVFSPRAIAAGLASVHSFPLCSDGMCIGALNLYAAAPLALDADAVEAAKLLADVATTYIMNCRNLVESHKLAGQLQRALDSRVVIEQAKGKLSERYRVSVTEAFEIMRRQARSHGRRLHDVAVDVMGDAIMLELPAATSAGGAE